MLELNQINETFFKTLFNIYVTYYNTVLNNFNPSEKKYTDNFQQAFLFYVKQYTFYEKMTLFLANMSKIMSL